MVVQKPLNKQAIALEEAEAQIRLLVKNEYLKGTRRQTIGIMLLKLIEETLKKITIPDLREASRISLMNFARRQYEEISRIRGRNLLVLLALMKLEDKNNELVKNMSISRAKGIISEEFPKEYIDDSITYGSPLQKYSKDYMEKNVTPVFERLAKEFPVDPGDISGANSLRNRAELEVRYNGHLENIEQLREQGNKLVIASTHADCSERCRKWQGRVYSLDGTSGTTPDGRKYIPLEEATDVYYTTKAGKTYKNGLLGFNCRHFLVPYKDGYTFSKINEKEERKQYAITEKQRALERNVRYWRTRALNEKNVNKEKYLYARRKAIEHNKKYIEFSKKHDRAYYPSRTKIIKDK